MRKDGKSQYQVKKEKLLKIKKILEEYKALQINKDELFNRIWEMVKNEKDND